MSCVKTVSFFVLISRVPHGPIFPSKGVRKGDTLSLYLFLLCNDGLISLLKSAVRESSVQGLRVC